MVTILEVFETGEYISVENWNYVPIMENPQNKTVMQLVKDDIINGTNKTGHAKYRKILKDEGLINEFELSTWRNKVSVKELDKPKLTS